MHLCEQPSGASTNAPTQLRFLAEQQSGVVALHQLKAIDLSALAIHRLDLHHGWERLSSTVWRRIGSPSTDAQRAVAAVLDAGENSYLAGESAASWWGHGGCRLEPFLVITDRHTTRRRTLAGKVRRVRHIDPRWVTTLRGVPVGRPELTALQLFASMRYERAERIVETFWSRRLLSGRSIALLVDDLGVRGRNGITGLRRYLEPRGVGYLPAGSGLETRVASILAGAGIPVRRQVDVGGEDRWSARVDFLHSRLPLVIEVQSEAHHLALVDERADAARREQLAAEGFTVVEVWDREVWTDPSAVIERVRHAAAVLCSPRFTQ